MRPTPSEIAAMNLVWIVYKSGRIARAAAVQRIMRLVTDYALLITEQAVGAMLDDDRSVTQQYHDAFQRENR